MKWKLSKLCAVLLAAALLVTGCAGGDLSWVYRGGDVEPPAGVYISLMIVGMTDVSQRLSEAGVENVAAMTPKELLAQTVEDQPADQWVASNAQEGLREYIAVEQQFAAEGIALPEGEEAVSKNTATEEWAVLGPMYEQNGVAQTSLELLLVNSSKRNALFSRYYDEGGKTPVPEEELKAILASDYFKVRYLPIAKAAADETAEDGTVTATVDEQNAAAKQQADDFQKRVAAGEPLLDLIIEYETAEAAAADAEIESHDDSSHMLILNDALAGTYYSEELVNGAKAIPMGECAVVEDDSFYYVLVRHDILEDPADFDNLRAAILSELKTDEFNAMVEGWAAALTLDQNQAALDHYTPKRLKLE